MSEFCIESYLQQLSAATNIDDCPKVPIPTVQRNQNYLFVSYSHKDYKLVYADLAHLYSRGVRFWYDKGLRAGKDWEKEVEEHIKDPHCCGVIFYLSTNMFLSDSVLKEIEFTRTRKRANRILQKNYFCVNLQEGNISDMLFESQRIKQSKGLLLLDTRVLNILTATFSDNATYIRYNSVFHVDELIDQIQVQFDVTSKPDENAKALPTLATITDSKAAIRAFWGKETALIPLCKYTQEVYRNNKKTYPWLLIPIGLLVGLFLAVAILYMLITAQDILFIKHLTEHYRIEYIMILTGIFSCAYSPYMILKLFWLYYLSPVYKKCENSTINQIINAVLFFGLSVMVCCISVPMCLVLMFITEALLKVFNTMTDVFQ